MHNKKYQNFHTLTLIQTWHTVILSFDSWVDLGVAVPNPYYAIWIKPIKNSKSGVCWYKTTLLQFNQPLPVWANLSLLHLNKPAIQPLLKHM